MDVQKQLYAGLYYWVIFEVFNTCCDNTYIRLIQKWGVVVLAKNVSWGILSLVKEERHKKSTVDIV